MNTTLAGKLTLKSLKKKSILSNILLINVVVVVLFAISLGLKYASFPYLLYIFGLLFYLLPGINYAYILEQTTRQELGKTKLLLWASLFFLIFQPALLLLSTSSFSQLSILLLAGMNFAFIVVSFIIIALLNKTGRMALTNLLNIKFDKKVLWLVFIFLAIIVLAMIIYPYLPEADGYQYLAKINESFGKNSIIFLDQRLLFLFSVKSLSILSNISPYFILKIVFPLFSIFLFLVFYDISNKRFNLKNVLIACSFLTIPIIISELLISRPQSLFLLFFPISLYLLNYLNTLKNNRKIYAYAMLLIISLIGAKIHSIFTISSLLILICLFISNIKQIKKYPMLVILIIVLAIASAYPWINDFGIINSIKRFIAPIINGITHIKPNLWFMDNYVNPDGNQMGWPGFSVLLYYGYNVGFLLLLLLIWAIVKKYITWENLKQYWIYTLSFILFFLIAEILPRLGVYYFPDRAWLFVSLTAILFLASVYSKEETKKINIYALLAGTASVLLTFVLIYLKQGWVNKYEIEAALFLKNNTPKDAIVLSQPGNTPLIEYYGQRYYVSGMKNILIEKDKEFIDNVNDLLTNKSGKLLLKENIENQLRKIIADLSKSFPDYTNVFRKQINAQLDIYAKNASRYKVMKQLKLDTKKEIYLLYSEQKFKSLYGTRSWWKKYNYYGADLNYLNNNYKLIYEKNGVYIWKTKEK